MHSPSLIGEVAPGSERSKWRGFIWAGRSRKAGARYWSMVNSVERLASHSRREKSKKIPELKKQESTLKIEVFRDRQKEKKVKSPGRKEDFA